MQIGIRNAAVTLADLLFTTTVALLSIGLAVPIAAGAKQKLKYWIPFSVGATGGVRAQLVVPAGGVIFRTSIKLINTVAPSITTASQAASAAFTNALANAGTHWLEIDSLIVNGNTAGNVDLQMAQNTSDALTLTVLQGANVDALILV
jgi:hypothetical protein